MPATTNFIVKTQYLIIIIKLFIRHLQPESSTQIT